MLLKFMAEFAGTMLLILLGDGAVANATLERSGMKGAGPVQITLAWGLAVMIPAFIFGNASGAHFNPALTIALAADRTIPWAEAPVYIAAQFAGAFAGACMVYLLFKDQLDATRDQGVKLGVFCTSPAVPNLPRNLLCELTATFVLVFAIKGIPGMEGENVVAGGLSKFMVFGIIVSIGMSLGGLTGYALNPARDIGPRVAHQLLPIKDKGGSNWGYAVVPIAGPIAGAALAVLAFAGLKGIGL